MGYKMCHLHDFSLVLSHTWNAWFCSLICGQFMHLCYTFKLYRQAFLLQKALRTNNVRKIIIQHFVQILCPTVNGIIPLKGNTERNKGNNLGFRGSKVYTV